SELKSAIDKATANDVINFKPTSEVKEAFTIQTDKAVTVNLNGSNRYETSLLIAKEIDKNHDVEKVYITNANGGEVDALTIA
ncbi:cell wall-binding repeat-containing protein, partial [Clostridioides difficile]|uniref:cell wall-binding repeat-containing protein n=1 Tax=Clostridioides difficile TaxID=1496 RepID=UPI0020B3B9D5